MISIIRSDCYETKLILIQTAVKIRNIFSLRTDTGMMVDIVDDNLEEIRDDN